MAQHHRLFDANRSKTTIMIVMEVRPANAAARHRYLNLAGAGIKQWYGAHSKIMRRMNDDGFDGTGHGFSNSQLQIFLTLTDFVSAGKALFDIHWRSFSIQSSNVVQPEDLQKVDSNS
jgi:hypothetical protein